MCSRGRPARTTPAADLCDDMERWREDRFTPSGPLGTKQWGYRDKVGTTTVQIDGDVIGAYLNSADLKDGSDHGMDKMMITPAWQPAVEARVKPFAEAGMALVESLELQIPTAVDANKPGNFTYAVGRHGV